MYTLCFTRRFADAESVSEMMRSLYQDGMHRVETEEEAVLRIMGNAYPDVVWLHADGENFALAEKCREISPETNFIFAAEDKTMAYDAFRLHASGYVLEPVTEESVRDELNNLRHEAHEQKARLRVQCFGNFEVFYRNRMVRFSRSLSKEALAYMIDRRGAGCTVSEICTVLWENRPVDTNLKSQCRVILASLKKDLEAVGAADVIVKGWNTWSIDAEKISCDYYDFLRNAGKSTDTYRGEYLSQYSWAEMTSGSLYQMTNS